MSTNLVDDFFDKGNDYEIAVFSTFGLNLNFLENYLLNLSGVSSCGSINIFTDSSVYESFSGGIYDYCPRWFNKKYMVTGVRAGKIFHPKVYLMASAQKAQIAIGSANLTREGITSNLEIMSIFNITKRDTRYSNILRDTVNFFGRLAEESKSQIAEARMRELEAIVSTLSSDSGSGDVRFIHNLDEPLLNQIVRFLSRGEVKNIKVLSPFYDRNLYALFKLREQYPNATIQIYIQQDKSNFPVDAYSNSLDGVELYLYRDLERYIHGKAILFQSDNSNYLFTGSANFTDSALLKKAHNANVEVGLFGALEEKLVADLFSPVGVKAEKIEDINMLQTTDKLEEGFEEDRVYIYYLLEAREEDDAILLTVDDEIAKDMFTPEKVILYKGNGSITVDFNTKIKPKESIKDIYAVQAVGTDDNNQTLLTNTIWILRLEVRDDYKSQTRYRRILNNPYDLEAVLNDIISTGDRKELVNFLETFDIPLDLILLPSSTGRFMERRSKGNVMGGFVQSRYNIFEVRDIYDLFDGFLDNLYNKLCSHYDNIQLQRLSNFILIYTTLFSMVRFIDNNIYGKYKEMDRKIVGAKKWAEIRKYYDMLLCYIEKTLKLMWIGKEGYRSFNEKVTDTIASDSQRILGDVETFKDYIERDYLLVYNEGINIGIDVVKHFKEMHTNIRVRTVVNTFVDPIISQNDVYINDIDGILGLLHDNICPQRG